jgi:PAS domain S-box-containing protein
MPVLQQPVSQNVTEAPTLVPMQSGLREQLMDPSLWRDALEKFARATSLAVALADAEGALLGECINPQPLWSLLRARQPSAGACPFELVLSHEPCTCVAASFRQGRPVVAHGRSGLAHVAVPLVLRDEPVGALLAGQVFDQYPEQLPLEQLARKFGIAPQAVWQLARLEHPVKEAVLRVYADLLMTLGSTFLQTRYNEVREAGRLAEMTRLRDRAVTEIGERQRAESALLRSELQFHNLLEKLPAGAYTCDPEGMITYFNQQAVQLWGRTPKLNDPAERFCGSFKLFSPDGSPIPHDQCWMALTLKAEREYNGQEIVVERPDGQRFTVLAHTHPIRDEAGKLLGSVNVVVDISERKQTEEALRRSELRLEAELADTKLLQALSGEMIHQEHVETLYDKILDAAVSIMRSDFASMQMLYPERGTPGSGGELRLIAFRGFNPQAAKFWEWVRPTATCSCGRALSTGQRCVVGDIETCAWMADSDNLATYRDTGIRAVQSTPLVSRGGRLLGMISTHWRTPHEPAERDLRLLDVLARQAADLIERSQAEAQLRASEDRFRSLLKAITSVVWTTDAEGRFVTPQPSWSEFTGQSWDELRDFGWLNALHPDDRERVRKLWEAARAAKTRYKSDGRLWHAASGSYRHFEARGVAILNPDGSVREWVGKCLDVEDRKRAEEALKVADRRKDEFLAMLAHELRNPLAPVHHAAQVLRLPGLADETLRWAGDVIGRQVQQLTRLVDDLLDVSRISRGKINLQVEPVDLAAVVARAVETSRPLIDAREHHLEVTLPEREVRVEGDPARLIQVVSNLLTNAAKYTEEGGRIVLTVEASASQAVIGVRDTGVGIAPEMLPRLFEMFTQVQGSVNRSEGGLGIGLSLVRCLVEMHGGNVQALSPGLGHGSEFVVRLPLLHEPLPPAPAAGATPPPQRKVPARRILVVDDNTDAATSLAVLLRHTGHEVRTADDGPAALDAARSQPPDVVLLDIGLPGMSGLEVARSLRQDLGLTGVLLVALTGYGQEEDKQRSQEAGFNAHMVKPVDLDALRELLAQSAHTTPGLSLEA